MLFVIGLEMEVFECEKEEVTNLEQKLADVEKILEQKQEQKKCQQLSTVTCKLDQPLQFLIIYF